MLALLRKTLPLLTVAVVVAVAYDGWIFYSRWREARVTERKIEAYETEQARQTIAMLGGGKLKILNFYATPGVIRAGERADVCYGVNGAKSVRIEPSVGELHPSIARCVQVSPAANTEYKLVVQDDAGHTETQSFILQVKR
jgi:hypothetical protein